jgi:hypothetical protein
MGAILSVIISIASFSIVSVFCFMAASKSGKCPKESLIQTSMGIGCLTIAILMVLLVVFFL